ncbi:hypothetical protein BSG1_11616 [Bacillus sp. SG-1]|nr:hypothetical protein BSG1_11616 [Bacillus sp. SG-1]
MKMHEQAEFFGGYLNVFDPMFSAYNLYVAKRPLPTAPLIRAHIATIRTIFHRQQCLRKSVKKQTMISLHGLLIKLKWFK